MTHRLLSGPRRVLGLVIVLVAATAASVFAQDPASTAESLASQSMRPYRFVFYAYALAWVLVAGWVFSIARRLSRLDERLGE